MSRNHNRIKYIFMITVASFIVFFATSIYLDENINNTSRTLLYFDDHPLTDEEMQGLEVDIVAQGFPGKPYKITKLPTYMILRTSTQEVLLVTNELDEIRDYLKKSQVIRGGTLKSFFTRLFSKNSESAVDLKQMSAEASPTTISTIPDKPVPFGYKVQWLAIQTSDTEHVVRQLELHNVQAANWSSGINSAYDGMVFVSPPVHGWTLVVSTSIPDASNDGLDALLNRIAANYESAQYFGSHRVVEYHAWVKIEKGKFTRKFAYSGESGELIWNDGALTEEEKQLNFRVSDISQEDYDKLWSPSEEDVMSLAGLWSINPQEDYPDVEEGVGFLGEW
ncbi:hypothetical protein ACFO9Q_11195 [Paenibacillus sp. GCM10023252]|uniref:hypothetical protein n=1 Tax=Paenibacillus sp. GCM10023252 TaxID=3252649 RepID=UPI00360845CF